eukprot:scaffold1595_cov171-Amphora_coffeaeformis.AAC.12
MGHARGHGLHTAMMRPPNHRQTDMLFRYQRIQQQLRPELSALIDNPFFQQVRWKRKDGARYHGQERPPTKKQRKRYNRQLQQKQQKEEHHGRPGSKAGTRREWADQWKEDVLNPPPDPTLQELEQYTIDDALLDDLVGNTSEAQPTPEPIYLGHKHRKFYSRVADQMDDFRTKMELLTAGESTENALLDHHIELPSDRDLSLVLRAYRDKEGTRRKPVGIVKALKHLLQDVGVPMTALGEMTYTTLLTCAASPVEGRRIIQMMHQHQHPVSAYSWSILVDVHSKIGDYKGCLEVHREMIAEGLKPTLASFTSLLAACYKVCIDGRVSHKLRDEAGKVAWEQWQEMRIVGINPDVMAYGAILRIMAARGKPEQALNILEEMQLNQVAPTTLCFTSALRAVARSHATAIRYEHGFSARHSRRENITAHHGKLAQSIVRMAESAEVEQDDGFIAALISCAASAGDLATAKAIFVANQIRRLDQFRTIGSEEHLARLRGEGADDDLEQLEWKPELLSDGAPSSSGEQGNNYVAVAGKGRKNQKIKSYGEREYGRDSRILSAVMQACANAAGSNMVGSMWQGRENEGYLCENSLRLLSAKRLPQYEDDSIPGAGRTDNLTWAGDDKDFDYRGNKRMSGKKFEGVYEDDNVAMTLDELDDTFRRYFVDKNGRRKPEYQKVTTKDVWEKRYGSKSGINEAYGEPRIEPSTKEDTKVLSAGSAPVAPTGGAQIASMHFNLDTMRWENGPEKKVTEKPAFKKLPPSEPKISSTTVEKEEELYFDTDAMKWKTRPKVMSPEMMPPETRFSPKSDNSSVRQAKNQTDKPQELYFDSDSSQWKVKEDGGNTANAVAVQQQVKQTTAVQALVAPSFVRQYAGSIAARLCERWESKRQCLISFYMPFDEDEFAAFLSELKEEVRASGADPSDIDEDEARELFAALDDDEGMVDLLEDEGDEEDFLEKLKNLSSKSSSSPTTSPRTATPMASASPRTTNVVELDDFQNLFSQEESGSSDDYIERLTEEIHSKASLQGTTPHFEESIEVVDEEMDAELEELRAVLPAFSERRLRKIQKAFAKNLSNPSLLELVKISREIMPDYVTNTWLKQMSVLTARYVMQKAIDDGLLDVHMLNGVLQLETSLGRLDRALEFHQTEYAKHRLQPTAYSDRLVLQMFLQNKRFSRALQFKEKVERDGRTIDLQSYGSLIEHCARRGQVGSSMLLLHECLDKHGGAHPGNAHLAQLRIAYRKSPDLDEKDLEALIGPDPIRWLKHGERHLKREMSKKGRRNVQFAENVLLQL